MRLKPYEQGKLDCMCGIYSVVNAARIIRNLNDDQSQELFKQIVFYLKDIKELPTILTEGMNIHVLGGILREVISEGIQRSIPFHKKPQIGIGDFWVEMMQFLNEGEDLGERRTILLSLDGAHEHWTVIRSMTGRGITLFDSDGLKHLSRRACTTIKATASRPHRLCPTQTYFLG